MTAGLTTASHLDLLLVCLYSLCLSNKLKSQDKSHDSHSRESPYSSGYAGGLQPAPQSPIYENFQSGQSNRHEFQSAVQSEHTHR